MSHWHLVISAIIKSLKKCAKHVWHLLAPRRAHEPFPPPLQVWPTSLPQQTRTDAFSPLLIQFWGNRVEPGILETPWLHVHLFVMMQILCLQNWCSIRKTLFWIRFCSRASIQPGSLHHEHLKVWGSCSQGYPCTGDISGTSDRFDPNFSAFDKK